MTISGNIVDIRARHIYHGDVTVVDGKIVSVVPSPGKSDRYIMPGFIDAHIHIESSMLIPTEFARLALKHGTVATISDPHEIGNVLGMQGVYYMIRNGEKAPLKFYFGAPSCVPATTFETAGTSIDANQIEELLADHRIVYLAEMMNYPGVLYGDEGVGKKIKIAQRYNKPIDGHAPGLRGEDAKKYAAAGISTDHECFTYEEAYEKLQLGMKILIREGSAAKNYEALHPLITSHPNHVMLCSDDKHPDDLILGHINKLVARSLSDGHDLFDILTAACLNPISHYGLDVGSLQVGDAADFIVVSDLKNFDVMATYVDGKNCMEYSPPSTDEVLNAFRTDEKAPQDFVIPNKNDNPIVRSIQVIDKEIVTGATTAEVIISEGQLLPKNAGLTQKITVVNRYEDAVPAVAFIDGFGIVDGAIASSVGHDSHNIIAVGSSDKMLAEAVNIVIKNKGGISAVNATDTYILPLPIAGIMTHENGYEVARKYSDIDRWVKEVLECPLTAPFMTLSFMGLLVIPSLKLSDKGLFDGNKFSFVSLQKE